MKRRSAQRRAVYAPPQCIETRRELESEQERRGVGTWKRVKTALRRENIGPISYYK
jgi:hypothetical protein